MTPNAWGVTQFLPFLHIIPYRSSIESVAFTTIIPHNKSYIL